VSEGEDAIGLPRMVRHLQCHLAGTNALALFTGGTLVENSGSNPFPPAARHLYRRIGRRALVGKARQCIASQPVVTLPPDPHRPSPAKTKAFLIMAWLANPFAYIAINTFIPLAALPGGAFPSLTHVRGISRVHCGALCGSAHLSCCGIGRTGITASAGW